MEKLGIRCLQILLVASFINKALGEVYVMSTRTNKTIEKFIDYQLEFSIPVPNHWIEGYAVVVEPDDACQPIKKAPDKPENVKWFAMIKRGGCILEDKVVYAEQANFDAAIIYNFGIPDENLSVAAKNNSTSGDSDDPDVKIVCILINEGAGTKIVNNYLFNQSAKIGIKSEPNFSFDDLLLPCTIVIGACIVVLTVFMLIKCIKNRRRNMRNRLSSRHLKHLQIIKFKKGTYQRYEVCAICLEEYCDGEKLRILPCNHAYHTKCIDPWLTNNRRNCPVCKRKVVIEGVTPDSDSESDTENNDNGNETTPLLVSRTTTTASNRSNEGYGGLSSSSSQEQVQQRGVIESDGSEIPVLHPTTTTTTTPQFQFPGRNIMADILQNVRRAGQRLNPGHNAATNLGEPLDNASSSSGESSYESVTSLLPQSDVNSINFVTSIDENRGASTSRSTITVVEVATEVTQQRERNGAARNDLVI